MVQPALRVKDKQKKCLCRRDLFQVGCVQNIKKIVMFKTKRLKMNYYLNAVVRHEIITGFQ